MIDVDEKELMRRTYSLHGLSLRSNRQDEHLRCGHCHVYLMP
jgi:hypothetical protein